MDFELNQLNLIKPQTKENQLFKLILNVIQTMNNPVRVGKQNYQGWLIDLFHLYFDCILFEASILYNGALKLKILEISTTIQMKNIDVIPVDNLHNAPASMLLAQAC